MSEDQNTTRPAAYCHPASAEDMNATRERRWATGSPVEVEQDLALMREKGAPPEVVGHAKKVLARMKNEFRIKYGHDYV